MRRLVALAVGTVFAACLAAWGAAATVSPSFSSRPEAASATLPPLPADIKARGRLMVAVKCDSPPFGSILEGRNVGVDVDIARQLALLAFGKKHAVAFTCVTTPEREAALTSGSADLVIATFSYTPDRDTRIDFSRAYYKASGRLLVKNNSSINSLSDIRGKRVATTSGSVYDRWMKRCFSNTEVVVTDSVTNAVIAFNQGRADAVMFDDTSLALIAATDPQAKMTNDIFLEGPYGIGIRQGNVQLKRWVDSRLAIMKSKDVFMQIIRNNIAPRFVAAFARNVLRPNNTFGYRAANLPSLDTVCP
jgi:polar amino acid transport system substrate-binding protein